MRTSNLDAAEFNPYYGRYIYKLSDQIDLREGFVEGQKRVLKFFGGIPKERLNFRYAPEKWTIKEVLQHLIDTERIFMYRCFRIARRDSTPLAGFNQNIYVDPSNANQKEMGQLLGEFEALRLSSISLINSLRDEDLESIGDCSGSPMSARAAAFTIIGHDIWHIHIIQERYLEGNDA